LIEQGTEIGFGFGVGFLAKFCNVDSCSDILTVIGE